MFRVVDSRPSEPPTVMTEGFATLDNEIVTRNNSMANRSICANITRITFAFFAITPGWQTAVSSAVRRQLIVVTRLLSVVTPHPFESPSFFQNKKDIFASFCLELN